MKELERREKVFNVLSTFSVIIFVVSSGVFTGAVIGLFSGVLSGELKISAAFMKAVLISATISATFWVVGNPVCLYHTHIKTAKEYRGNDALFAIYTLRVKMSFDTFLPIFNASQKSWSVCTESAIHTRIESRKSISYYKTWSCDPVADKYITIIYFDYGNFKKYYRWISQKQKEDRQTEARKVEAERRKRELDLNLMFLEAVAKDVEKMKISAEEELNKGLTELERIRDNISQ